MGLGDTIKITFALRKHQKGEIEEARAIYEDLYSRGCISSRYLLPYSIMLLRDCKEESYHKAKEVLLKAQKAADLSENGRSELLLNFAVADFKLGNVEKAVELMERVHQKYPSGNTYSTLGYLYVEEGDAEKALELNTAALEYDDEDPIVLDNMGQTYYRLLNDKEKALEYFKKAHEIKPGQIDTLWFLSRYDLEADKKEEAIEKLETALEGRFSPLNYVTKAKIEEELKHLRG